MTLLAEYLFPILWGKNYINHIIFAGNHYAKDGPSLSRNKRAEKEFNNDMSSYFENFCRKNIDGKYNTPMKVWNYKDYLYPHWDNFEEHEKDIEEKIKRKIEEIIDENTFIGIDLCLNTKDDEPEDDESEDETLAMKLFYSYLIEQNKKNIFLYSNFINEKAEKEEWIKKFLVYHNKKKRPNEQLKDKIIVYSGYELAKETPGEDLNRFLEFLESGSINGAKYK